MRRLAIAVLALHLCAGGASQALAQGFFQNLFGGGGQPSGYYPQSPVPPSPYGYRAPLHIPQHRSIERERRHDDGEHRGGRYRTLCVRMCDGYYWPVSFQTNRSSFYRDANICRASCGEEAKLFFHSSKEADVTNMVDVTGRAYTKLATAYLYRKRQVEGCKCKPDPWSVSEISRHRMYAFEAEQKRWRAEMTVAGASSPVQPGPAPSGAKAIAAETIAGNYDKPQIARPGPNESASGAAQDRPSDTSEGGEPASAQAEEQAAASEPERPAEPLTRRTRQARQERRYLGTVPEGTRAAKAGGQRLPQSGAQAPAAGKGGGLRWPGD